MTRTNRLQRLYDNTWLWKDINIGSVSLKWFISDLINFDCFGVINRPPWLFYIQSAGAKRPCHLDCQCFWNE